MEHKGLFLETFSGNRFYPQSPDPEVINIVDIAHALSMMCRFNGHCRTFYSVAQHSLNVAKEIARHGHEPIIQLYGLLHDASEAYIADINRPAKDALPDYKRLEGAVESAILEAFHLPEPTEYTHKIVKYFDDQMLQNEARSLLRCKEFDLTEYEPFPLADISERSMYDVAWEFAELFTQLYGWIRDDLERQYESSKNDKESDGSTTTDKI